MKKMILFVAASFLAVSMFAQTATPVKKAEDFVKFKELTYNFGKIKQSAPVTHDFVFTNTIDWNKSNLPRRDECLSKW